MTKQFAIISLLFITTLNIAQSIVDPLITGITSRNNTTSLNGNWEYIIDQYETGFYDYRFEEKSDGFFENKQETSPMDLVEYAFLPNKTLNVPGDWNSQEKELLYYEGAIWYKKTFDYSLQKGKRLHVHFGAVNYKCHVYLNGKKIGSHEGGFTPFNFEITKHLKPTKNDLVVLVENKRAADRVPTVNTDWWNYGGITRDVNLIETASTFIQQYEVSLKEKDTKTISGWVLLNGENISSANIEIPELNITKNITIDKTNKGYFSFKASPSLWSPESPKLYQVIITAGTSKIKDDIGFRTIEVKDKDILLNGKPIFLKGVCIHEEAPKRTGRANGPEDATTLLNWAKEMNCNYVRLAHYPHNEHMLKLADKLGLLVWSEIPVYWTIQWKNPKTLALAKQQLIEMIDRDRNRASIIIWSMANETPVIPERLTFISDLAKTARILDPSRLISAALEVEWGNPILLHDPLGEYLDVLGCNEYVGWYGGTPEDAATKKWATTYNKPLVISEFGGGALYGNHGSEDAKWTEEYQQKLFVNQLIMLDGIDFLRGVTPWVLMDFRSPRRLKPGIQDGWNRKGLISDQGQKKLAFDVMKEYYSKKAIK